MKLNINKHYLSFKINRKIMLLSGIGLFVLIELSLFIFLKTTNDPLFKKNDPQTISLKTYADRVIEACKGAKYKPSCYDDLLPKLIEKISMEETFRVTELVQAKDESYTFCHVVGHRVSSYEVRKNPDNWKNVIAQCPEGVCTNGCIHGGLMEKFHDASTASDEELQPIINDLTVICETRPGWNPSSAEKSACFHTLGHISMYLTDADIPTSLTVCSRVTDNTTHEKAEELCYNGIFMQLFQPLEPEDFALIKNKQPTKDTIPAFCNQFSDKEKGACITESWPLFRDEIQQPNGIVRHCSSLSGEHKERCAAILFQVVTTLYNYDQDSLIRFCKNLPSSYTGVCFKSVASRMIDTDLEYTPKAITICQQAPTSKLQDDCMEDILSLSTYNFSFQSSEQKEFCTYFHDSWNSSCHKRIGI